MFPKTLCNALPGTQGSRHSLDQRTLHKLVQKETGPLHKKNLAPPASAAPASLTSPPGEEQTCSMEVDDRDEHQTPASPVSHREYELLTGDTAVGVEGEMANLTVSSPGDCDGGDEGASI